ncbi:MAG: hypothetical protein QGE94_02765 [Desulfobacterales bacterium]|nr:hypothetical protein [Desulfobacterales bacterium]
MLAVGGKGKHICRFLHEESGRPIEQVFTEVEDEHGKYEIETPQFCILGNHVCDTLVEKFNLVDDPCADGRVAFENLFELKGIFDACNIFPWNYVTAPVGDGIGRILSESLVVDFRSDIEHIAAVDFFT